MKGKPSSFRVIDLLCPDCRSRNSVTLWERVESSDKELVNKVLDGSLFDVPCRGCEQVIPGDHSIDFHDPVGKLFVRYEAQGNIRPAAGWTAALGENQSAEEYRLLRVGSQHAFIELVRIWNEGLDPIAMLLIKHQLAGQVAREFERLPVVCSFDRRNDSCDLEYVVLVREEDELQSLTVPSAAYEYSREIAVRWQSSREQAAGWIDWNQNTVHTLIEATASL